jgi:hypothetical protein
MMGNGEEGKVSKERLREREGGKMDCMQTKGRKKVTRIEWRERKGMAGLAGKNGRGNLV